MTSVCRRDRTDTPGVGTTPRSKRPPKTPLRLERGEGVPGVGTTQNHRKGEGDLPRLGK